MKDPGDAFSWLLELVGISVEGSSERAQTIAFLASLALFGCIAAMFTEGLAQQLWAGVAVLSAVLLAIVLVRRTE